MSVELDFPIRTSGQITDAVLRQGIDSFHALAKHVRRLPYGRPVDAEDVLAVLQEQLGTCSSKHRLLAAVAHECGRFEVELVVGIYQMSEENTPGVGLVLKAAELSSIPEAHCYLRVGSRRYDYTGLSNGAASPFDTLLSEHVVPPANLQAEKTKLHHEAVQRWAAQHELPFAEAWAVREACIGALVVNNALQSAH